MMAGAITTGVAVVATGQFAPKVTLASSLPFGGSRLTPFASVVSTQVLFAPSGAVQLRRSVVWANTPTGSRVATIATRTGRRSKDVKTDSGGRKAVHGGALRRSLC